MQPIVGVLSDRCTSKFGRRRPFLLLGSAIVALGLLLIGWTREITSIFTGSQEGDTVRTSLLRSSPNISKYVLTQMHSSRPCPLLLPLLRYTSWTLA